jgi:phage FluMu protein Com
MKGLYACSHCYVVLFNPDDNAADEIWCPVCKCFRSPTEEPVTIPESNKKEE